MTNATSPSKKSLTSLSFPRTGKRGVPQQFPRRLYEMLDGETKLLAASAAHPKLISWSDSGKAFGITDVVEFAASVLPKYFRTKKFSSFQRNLNLYGFTKIRRGPETDMYAHESFLRDRPELLLELRKTAAVCQRLQQPENSMRSMNAEDSRAVSPSPSGSVDSRDTAPVQQQMSNPRAPPANHHQQQLLQIPQWAHVQRISPVACEKECTTFRPANADWGKLDLLAFALAQAAGETN